LPTPQATCDLGPNSSELSHLGDWLGAGEARRAHWCIGSVERTVAARLVDWLREQGAEQIVLLAAGDLPLEVALPRPDMVGIDRLLGAVAANQLRRPDTPAIIVDLGTAITVDLVTAEGRFAGGAILPGIGLSARALHEHTDLLPLLDMHELADAPPALGTDTRAAMRAGIYWGSIGAVRQLIEQLGSGLSTRPQVILTGGAAPAVASRIADAAVYAPHLVLGGIALAAGRLTSGPS